MSPPQLQGKAPHPYQAGPASARSRGTPAEGQAAGGELAATERYRVAGRLPGADGIEPLAKSFGACSISAQPARRIDAEIPAAAPNGGSGAPRLPVADSGAQGAARAGSSPG